MICGFCGALIEEGENVCKNCGNTIDYTSPEEVVVSDDSKRTDLLPVGVARKFPLEDKILEVTEGMDLFNSYRSRFSDIALRCKKEVEKATNDNVHDLISYVQIFPDIYSHYLDYVAKTAFNILVAEGCYTITYDSFLEEHRNTWHLVFDDIKVTVDSIQLTVQKKQQMVSAITGLVPNLVGGGFGLKGALIGAAKAEAFNIVRNFSEEVIVGGVARLNQAQQDELYGRINYDILFEHVYLDYWRVFLTMVKILKDSGKDLWYPSDENTIKAKNIFQNFSNPYFPEEKKLEMFLTILETMPYNTQYREYMFDKWGKNEQTIAINEYFGSCDE